MTVYVKNTPFSSENLYLDSKNAYYVNGVYTFNLDKEFTAKSQANMIISVKEARFMNAFANIRTNINDTITITGFLSGINTYIIPEDYYNVEQFCNKFNDMTANSIICSYSESSLKLTFTSLTEDFILSSSSNVLGMLNKTASSTLGILTMPLIMDFSGLDYIFVKI